MAIDVSDPSSCILFVHVLSRHGVTLAVVVSEAGLTDNQNELQKNKSEAGDSPGESHLQALQHDRLEVEDLGVQVDGAQCAGCDDHTLKLGKHRLHGQASIQAAQLQGTALP